ncbi:HAMP domain-containing histidine kinase [Candidatus Poribacteria bacterium]|nr:HAMP domain-containing histidine kinase [Candidatus Poribacteria bacterium]
MSRLTARRGSATHFLRNYIVGGVLGLLVGFIAYTQWIIRGLEASNRALIEPLAQLSAYLPSIRDREQSELVRQIVAGVAEHGRIRFIIASADGTPVVARGVDRDLEAKLDADQPLTAKEASELRVAMERMESAASPLDLEFALLQGRRVIGSIYYADADATELADLPFVLVDVEGSPIAWRIYGPYETLATSGENAARARALVRDAERDGRVRELQIDPPMAQGRFFYELRPLRALEWMPYVQIALVGGFLAGGLALYRRIRVDEQAATWAGLAKESAHQLGTPVTSLMGWLDLARESGIAAGPAGIDVVAEMATDVARLQRVVSRFAQVGQIPNRAPVDVNAMLEEAVRYFRSRLPSRSKSTTIEANRENTPPVLANADLMQWVFENLIRNALDAIDASDVDAGHVQLVSRNDARNRQVRIAVADNGGGLPKRNWRRAFAPGFTTKKHGWGVGLTLAERIVVTYHGGQIRIVESSPSGTTFEVILPYAPTDAGERDDDASISASHHGP